jgi:hypothetical protein
MNLIQEYVHMARFDHRTRFEKWDLFAKTSLDKNMKRYKCNIINDNLVYDDDSAPFITANYHELREMAISNRFIFPNNRLTLDLKYVQQNSIRRLPPIRKTT